MGSKLNINTYSRVGHLLKIPDMLCYLMNLRHKYDLFNNFLHYVGNFNNSFGRVTNRDEFILHCMHLLEFSLYLIVNICFCNESLFLNNLVLINLDLFNLSYGFCLFYDLFFYSRDFHNLLLNCVCVDYLINKSINNLVAGNKDRLFSSYLNEFRNFNYLLYYFFNFVYLRHLIVDLNYFVVIYRYLHYFLLICGCYDRFFFNHFDFFYFLCNIRYYFLNLFYSLMSYYFLFNFYNLLNCWHFFYHLNNLLNLFWDLFNLFYFLLNKH
jgi:hypothetical protein